MIRLFTKNATGVAPDGRWFAGDINAIQDAVAAINDLTQALGVGTVAIGESGLQFLRFGPGEARVSGAMRTDGIMRGLGGMIAGAFTTTQRNAIATGLAPYGIIILNTTTNQYEWNKGTDTSRNWQAIGSTLSSGVDVLANRPAASSVIAGSTYFATDQVANFISNGSAWVRESTPAGATVEWHSSAGAPAGWTAYDGTNLPASTGIYADLYAALGNSLTKPDTRGRVSVAQGTHTDANTIGQSDGLAVATRSPKHNMTNGLSLPNHGHGINDPGHGHNLDSDVLTAFGGGGYGNNGQVLSDGTQSTAIANQTGITIGNPTSNPGIPGTIGPGGTRPTDSPAFIVCLKIAKL